MYSGSYEIINDALKDNVKLRIIPSDNIKLKDDMFILQLYTDNFNNKQIYINKKDVGKLIDALKTI
jgi:hypothetical protein